MNIIAKPLINVVNGNSKIVLHKDGTRIISTEDDEIKLISPANLDLKITNKCNIGCPYCHEESNPEGKEANVDFIKNYFKDQLPMEIAIGGGDPLSHTYLKDMLMALRSYGHIANITVNQKSLNLDSVELLNQFIKEKLIRGIGISMSNFDMRFINKIKSNDIVLHLIAGVHNLYFIEELVNIKKRPKILILGYKVKGRGIGYNSESLQDRIKSIKENIPKLLKLKSIISFDNLALEQLELQKHFTKEFWDENYQGTDGDMSMYLDATTEMFALSSTEKQQYKCSDLIDDFKFINNL